MKNISIKIALFMVVLGFVSSTSIKSHDQFLSRVWVNTCKIFYCQEFIEACVANGCFGESSCKSCVSEISTSCIRCANEIFLEAQDYVGNGVKTITCDPLNDLHRAACSFFCNGNFKRNSRCSRISGFPLCECLF